MRFEELVFLMLSGIVVDRTVKVRVVEVCVVELGWCRDWEWRADGGK